MSECVVGGGRSNNSHDEKREKLHNLDWRKKWIIIISSIALSDSRFRSIRSIDVHRVGRMVWVVLVLSYREVSSYSNFK